MAPQAVQSIWETIITTTVATGVNDIYIWHAATFPVPVGPTTYTYEGLRIVELSPTELVIAGATQDTSADQTVISGGPQITLPSGKDWLPQTISLGSALYLGPRTSTDTYPPQIEVTITDPATAFPTIAAPTLTLVAETQSSTTPSVISSGATSTMILPSSTSTVNTLHSLKPSTLSAQSLITFTSNGPGTISPAFTTAALFATGVQNQSSGFITSTGTSVPKFNVTTFVGGTPNSYETGWSSAYVIVSILLSMGLRWKLWA
ncbi:mucin 6, oligomeric mucus gel-forming [Ptychographa xylographoides]|nr:mucin 6, oligomeric mucus gel-forming [Ptychographa xylographoides]